MQNLQNVICITDRHLCHRPFPDQMRIVASLGPKAIILREKDVMEDTYKILAERVLPACEEYDVPSLFQQTCVDVPVALNYSYVFFIECF